MPAQYGSDSLYQYFRNYIKECGLWTDEWADEIMEALVKSQGAMMSSRWSDTHIGYPPMLMSHLTLAANQEAVKWIDANMPDHFARAMFDGTAANTNAGFGR